MDIDRIVREFAKILRLPINRVRLDIKSLMAEGYSYDEKEGAFIKRTKRNGVKKVIPCDCGYAFEHSSCNGARLVMNPDGAVFSSSDTRVDVYNMNGHHMMAFPR